MDAAHIVPVRSPRSTDDVTNGLALCRLHHAAYDAGLIGVKPDYMVVINPAAIERLQTLGFLRGLAEFNALAMDRIRYPTVIEVQPNPEMLRLGMRERNWPEDLIG